jgi:hypothetical protein
MCRYQKIIKTHPQAKIRVIERRKKNLKSNTTIGAAMCTVTIGAAARNPNYQGSRKERGGNLGFS